MNKYEGKTDIQTTHTRVVGSNLCKTRAMPAGCEHSATSHPNEFKAAAINGVQMLRAGRLGAVATSIVSDVFVVAKLSVRTD